MERISSLCTDLLFVVILKEYKFLFNSDQGVVRYPEILLRTHKFNYRSCNILVYCLFFFCSEFVSSLNAFLWPRPLLLNFLAGSGDLLLSKVFSLSFHGWLNNISLNFWHTFMFVLFFQGEEDTEHILILFLLNTVSSKRVREGPFWCSC